MSKLPYTAPMSMVVDSPKITRSAQVVRQAFPLTDHTMVLVEPAGMSPKHGRCLPKGKGTVRKRTRTRDRKEIERERERKSGRKRDKGGRWTSERASARRERCR